jgi:DNA-binding transcriptional ArsR family regulator
MQVLKLKVKTQSKVELANLLIRTYCLFTKTKISLTEAEVLSYFAVYGFKQSTKDLILRSAILNSYNSLENTLTKLRKSHLIERNKDGESVLKKELSSTIENKMGIIIQLENL